MDAPRGGDRVQCCPRQGFALGCVAVSVFLLSPSVTRTCASNLAEPRTISIETSWDYKVSRDPIKSMRKCRRGCKTDERGGPARKVDLRRWKEARVAVRPKVRRCPMSKLRRRKSSTLFPRPPLLRQPEWRTLLRSLIRAVHASPPATPIAVEAKSQ
jgi:hypothetical protein